jgi:hypothetical protein
VRAAAASASVITCATVSGARRGGERAGPGEPRALLGGEHLSGFWSTPLPAIT